MGGLQRGDQMFMRMSKMLAMVMLLAASGVGCESPGFLLHDEQEWTTQWETFGQVRQAFDQVVPRQTSLQELKTLGFDPYTNPSIAVLSYMDVFKRFHPTSGFSLADHDPAIRECFEARENCRGLQLSSRRFRDKERGNVLLSMLTFQERHELTQWTFTGLIVLIDDRVVYKLWEGAPSVRTETNKVRPLGPLTNPVLWLQLF